MNDKERLEEYIHVAVKIDEYKKLKEQAEKAQELEKYYISEKRLKELLNGNEDIGELYQFVEDNQKMEDVISMIIKEMGYLAGALDDYNKGFFDLEKQNKRYREALERIAYDDELLSNTDDIIAAKEVLEGEE